MRPAAPSPWRSGGSSTALPCRPLSGRCSPGNRRLAVSCRPSAPTCRPIPHADDAGLAEAGWLQAAQGGAVGDDGDDALPSAARGMDGISCQQLLCVALGNEVSAKRKTEQKSQRFRLSSLN